jgi:hypothetical protein
MIGIGATFSTGVAGWMADHFGSPVAFIVAGRGRNCSGDVGMGGDARNPAAVTRTPNPALPRSMQIVGGLAGGTG